MSASNRSSPLKLRNTGLSIVTGKTFTAIEHRQEVAKEMKERELWVGPMPIQDFMFEFMTSSESKYRQAKECFQPPEAFNKEWTDENDLATKFVCVFLSCL